MHKQGFLPFFENDLEVRVESWIQLNAKEYRLMVDPRVDLAEVESNLLPNTWIAPLRDDLEKWYFSGAGGI